MMQQNSLVTLKMQIIWDGTPWYWVSGSQCFRGMHSLHLPASSSLLDNTEGTTEPPALCHIPEDLKHQ